MLSILSDLPFTRKTEKNVYLQSCKFWMIELTKTPILPNCQVPNGFFWFNSKFSLQILKSKHLVSLCFWDISCNSRAKIFSGENLGLEFCYLQQNSDQRTWKTTKNKFDIFFNGSEIFPEFWPEFQN